MNNLKFKYNYSALILRLDDFALLEELSDLVELALVGNSLLDALDFWLLVIDLSPMIHFGLLFPREMVSY